jgi:hypothetical protein
MRPLYNIGACKSPLLASKATVIALWHDFLHEVQIHEDPRMAVLIIPS